MESEIKEILKRTKKTFPKSFINEANELILEPKNNIYFRLEDVKNELEFKCKLIAWVSRPISKGLSASWSKKVLMNFNELLGTNFTKEEMREVYTYLGNDVNNSLCIKFIESKYDLSLLKK
jgi:hypothetical protein